MTLADGRKLGLVSPHLIPKVALCDPELTLGLPPLLTAATGMDALAHCLETFLSPRVNPPADAIALDGLARGMNRATMINRWSAGNSPRSDIQEDSGKRKELYGASTVPFKSRDGCLGGRGVPEH